MRLVNPIRFIVIFVSMIVGLLAVYGGLMLMLEPSGETMQFPLELLETTPFSNYFIPGLILIITIGFYGWTTVTLTWLKHRFYPQSILCYGLLLIGWLTAELILNPDFFWPGMHYSLYTVGILFVGMSFLLMKKLSGQKA